MTTIFQHYKYEGCFKSFDESKNCIFVMNLFIHHANDFGTQKLGVFADVLLRHMIYLVEILFFDEM